MHLSDNLFAKAKQFMPGGVNSPVRSFNGVGGNPIFIKQGAGSHLYSVDGERYIDYVGSWGPLILGHAHPAVVLAAQNAIANGMSFGAPTAVEVEMAELISTLIPSVEMVRMVNSGTEATMSAIRLARGFTGRNKILKFIGCYHGHADSLLVKAGSGLLTFGIPSCPGVPADFVRDTLTAHFNDINGVEQIFSEFGQDIAAIIVEPVACNMNCVLPTPEFLTALRTICDRYRSVLIFDEVITGFRVALGGAQAYYGVKPDLTTLGKIIGGGMPVGAYGGARAIMEHLAPIGSVYQAGTLSGNPVAMSAGLATLKVLQEDGFYSELEHKTRTLINGLMERASAANIPLRCSQIASIFGLFFTESDIADIHDFQQVAACDIELFKRFFHGMLAEGVYLAPSAFEAGFVSLAHTDEDICQTLDAAEKVFGEIR